MLPNSAGRMQLEMDKFYNRTIIPYIRSLVGLYGYFTKNRDEYSCHIQDLPTDEFFTVVTYLYEYYGLDTDWFNLLDFIPALKDYSIDNDLMLAANFRKKVTDYYAPLIQELLDEYADEYWHEWHQDHGHIKKIDQVNGEIYYR